MKNRNWKEIAELVALIAVVGGLAAVVVELRQTQVALRAQAYQARAFDAIAFNWNMTQDPAIDLLATDFESGQIDIDALEPHQKSKLVNLYYVKRTDLDNEHFQYMQGLLDEDFYKTTTVPEIKALAPYWRSLQIGEPRRAFTEEVDRILADPSIRSALE